MNKLFLSVLSFLLLFSFSFAVRGGQQGECQIRRINAQEPSYSIRAEGGETEFWDYKNDQFQCAGVSIRRHRIQQKGLLLPLYHNAPVLVYVVRGLFHQPMITISKKFNHIYVFSNSLN